MLQVAYAESWSASREQTSAAGTKDVVKKYDWFYSTTYKGTCHPFLLGPARQSFLAHMKSAPPPLMVPARLAGFEQVFEEEREKLLPSVDLISKHYEEDFLDNTAASIVGDVLINQILAQEPRLCAEDGSNGRLNTVITRHFNRMLNWKSIPEHPLRDDTYKLFMYDINDTYNAYKNGLTIKSWML
ncbi:hypothetical protein PG988_011211 [Apiospora saccharicola]